MVSSNPQDHFFHPSQHLHVGGFPYQIQRIKEWCLRKKFKNELALRTNIYEKGDGEMGLLYIDMNTQIIEILMKRVEELETHVRYVAVNDVKLPTHHQFMETEGPQKWSNPDKSTCDLPTQNHLYISVHVWFLVLLIIHAYVAPTRMWNLKLKNSCQVAQSLWICHLTAFITIDREGKQIS